MMKIAHVLAWVSRNAGGLFNSVSGLAKAQTVSGREHVEVFGVTDDYSGQDRAHWSPVPVHTAPVLGPKRFCYAPLMRAGLDRYEPDLVHCGAVWTWPAWLALDRHVRRGTPYIVSPRGTLDAWALQQSVGLKKLALTLFQRKQLHRAACLHALNENELRSIRLFGLRNPVCVIPNGVDLPPDADRGKPSATMPEVRRCLGEWAIGKRVLLYLGRLHPKKGLVNLVRAWTAVRSNPDIRQKAEPWILVVAGWDELGHRDELKRLATSLATEGLYFTGPKYGAEKELVYRASDALILPSLSEGLPMTVLEAWSYRLPAVMTEFCNIPLGFSTGAALQIAPEQKSIEDGLCSLFAMSDEARMTMGAKARELAATRFSWAQIAHEMHDVYDWVVHGGTPPSNVKTE